MEIKKIQTSDLAVLASMYANTFNSPPWNEPWTEEKALHRLSHFFNSNGFVGLLMEDAGKPIGMLMGTKEPFHFGMLFYLREMCVKTNYQNRGLGGQLMSALKTTLIEQGVVGQYLTTERSIPAATFYQKHGFQLNNDIGFYFQSLSEQALM